MEGGWAITGGARLVRGAVDPAGVSVGPRPVVAGFGGGYCPGGPLKRRTATPTGRGWRLSVFRWMPVFGVIRLSERPWCARAMSCNCLAGYMAWRRGGGAG
jgi:hypothetical protein